MLDTGMDDPVDDIVNGKKEVEPAKDVKNLGAAEEAKIAKKTGDVAAIAKQKVLTADAAKAEVHKNLKAATAKVYESTANNAWESTANNAWEKAGASAIEVHSYQTEATKAAAAAEKKQEVETKKADTAAENREAKKAKAEKTASQARKAAQGVAEAEARLKETTATAKETIVSYPNRNYFP